MSLVIPDSHANILITISNGSGGASAKSSISVGVSLLAPLTQGHVGRIANVCRDALTPQWDNGWLVGPCHFNETDSGVEKVWDDTGTEAGTHAAAVYSPPATSLVVTKVTGIAGKAFRGRFFLPGVTESLIDEAGIVDGALVNSTQAIVDDLFSDLSADASVGHLVLFHDSSSPGAHGPTEIASFLVRNVVGTMRPRQRR